MFCYTNYSPLLKKTCVRQVVLDKWFPLNLVQRHDHGEGHGSSVVPVPVLAVLAKLLGVQQHNVVVEDVLARQGDLPRQFRDPGF